MGNSQCCNSSACVVSNETMDVKTVAIRVQMPDTLRAQFKARCALQGKTMNEVVVALIEKWLSESPPAE
ncbi:MAG: hypothetical protein F6J95_019575 [Leptolyngbya sp. SIO1E4]|nr:hypothetical protein [Leptolyngbya sp. SIO1E4]